MMKKKKCRKMPENPMEKMMSGWSLTKNLLNNAKYFCGEL